MKLGIGEWGLNREKFEDLHLSRFCENLFSQMTCASALDAIEIVIYPLVGTV